MSNYGTSTLTVIPYSLAFGLCLVCTLIAGHGFMSIRRQGARMLFVDTFLLAVILGSTYSYQTNVVTDIVHTVAGGALFVFQLVVSLLLAKQLSVYLRVSLLAVQLIGVCVIVLATLGVVHILPWGESIDTMAFSSLLVCAFRL